MPQLKNLLSEIEKSVDMILNKDLKKLEAELNGIHAYIKAGLKEDETLKRYMAKLPPKNHAPSGDKNKLRSQLHDAMETLNKLIISYNSMSDTFNDGGDLTTALTTLIANIDQLRKLAQKDELRDKLKKKKDAFKTAKTQTREIMRVEPPVVSNTSSSSRAADDDDDMMVENISYKR